MQSTKYRQLCYLVWLAHYAFLVFTIVKICFFCFPCCPPACSLVSCLAAFWLLLLMQIHPKVHGCCIAACNLELDFLPDFLAGPTHDCSNNHPHCWLHYTLAGVTPLLPVIRDLLLPVLKGSSYVVPNCRVGHASPCPTAHAYILVLFCPARSDIFRKFLRLDW